MKTRHIDLAVLGLVATLAALAVLSGCSGRIAQQVASADTVQRIVIRDRIKDTIIYVPADSSAITYLVECQGDRARLVQMLNYAAGKQVAPPQIVIRDRYLTAVCKVDSQAVYMRMKASDTTRITSTERVVIETRQEPSGWQWAQIWAGRIAGLLLLIYLAVVFGRKAINNYPHF